MVGVSVDIVDIEQSPQTVPGPLGLPPVLITFDDLIIFEPIAIARYLAVASSQLLGGRLSSLVDSWTIFCVQKVELVGVLYLHYYRTDF
jgi:glutathione S-transferase